MAIVISNMAEVWEDRGCPASPAPASGPWWGMGSRPWASVVSSGPVGTLDAVVALGAPGLVVCAVALVHTEEWFGGAHVRQVS